MLEDGAEPRTHNEKEKTGLGTMEARKNILMLSTLTVISLVPLNFKMMSQVWW